MPKGSQKAATTNKEKVSIQDKQKKKAEKKAAKGK